MESKNNNVINGKNMQRLREPEPNDDRLYVSDYAVTFDENCPAWSPNRELNLWYLRRMEEYFNEVLRHRGYVYLFEIYQMLGIPWPKWNDEIGWKYDEENPIGDNYVDFDIFSERIEGEDPSISLDFNVDGLISKNETL